MALLEAADPYLENLSPTSELLPAYAAAFKDIDLLRRAQVLLKRAVPHDVQELRNINAALKRFGAPAPEAAPWNTEASLTRRLEDALKAPPLNPWYDYDYVPDNANKSADDGSDDEEPLSRTRLLASLYHGSHLPTHADEDRVEASLEMSHVEPQRLDAANLEALTLDPTIGNEAHKTATKKLLRVAGYSQEVTEGFLLSNVQHERNLWLISGSSGDKVYSIIYSNLPSPHLFRYSSEMLDSEAHLLDLFGDGTAFGLVTSSVQGSAAILDETIFSLENGNAIWSGSSAGGGILPVHLAGADSLELLTQDRTQIRTVDCNQCPAIVQTTLYQLRRGQKRFRLVSRRNGEAEISRGGKNGISGVGPRLLLEVESKDWVSAIGVLKNSGLTLSARQFKETADTAIEYADTLVEAGNFQQAANVFLMVRGVAAKRKDAPNFVEMVKLTSEKTTEAYLEAGLFDQARQVLSPLSVQANFMRNKADQNRYRSILSLIDLQSGRLGLAYQGIQQLMEVPEMPKAQLLGNLAFYYLRTGDYQSAYDTAIKALDTQIQESAGFPRKVETEDQSVERLGDVMSSDDVALDMIWAASSAEELGHSGIAADWLLRAFRVVRGLGNSSAALQIYAAEVGARTALRLHNPDLATAFLDDALGAVDLLDWNDSGGGFLLLYGQVFAAQGQIADSENAWQAAASISQSTSYNDLVSAEFELARSRRSAHDLTHAVHYAEEAFREIARGRLAIGAEKQKLTFLSDKKQVVELLLTLYIETSHSSTDILRVIEGWKLRAFLDLYSATGKDVTPGPISDLSSNDLSEALHLNQTFVDYFIGRELSIAVVVSSHNSPQAYRLPTEGKRTSQQIKVISNAMDLRNPANKANILNGELSPQLTSALRDAFDAFLSPLQKSLSETETLIVSPDESMFGLPWAALQDGHKDLIDRFPIVISPSAAMYVQGFRRNTGLPASSLVVGEFRGVPAAEVLKAIPAADQGEALGSLPQLLGGAGEVRDVGAELASRGSVKFLLNSASNSRESQNLLGPPTRANVLREIPKYGIVHITAHGVFSLSDPMSSSLFLAPENERRTVAAREFLDLPLNGVGLITLAACQTAESARGPGAEPFGFQRALFGAGVSNMLLTGWEIDDATSARLFSSFYGNLRRTAKPEALRKAQLTVRHSHAHPYYWASVSLYGQAN